MVLSELMRLAGPAGPLADTALPQLPPTAARI